MRRMRFETFAAEVHALYSPPGRARRTQRKMRHVLDRFAAAARPRTTADLSAVNVARFVTACADEGLGPNTIRGYLAYLSGACAYAVHAGYLGSSPFGFRKVWVRRASPRKPRHHPIADVARWLDHLRAGATTWDGGRLYALGATYALAALRRDEALRLRVADIDPAARVLFIEPRHRLKTEASAAPVPIPTALADVLADWLARCGSEWAFPHSRRSGPWTGGPAGRRAGDRIRQSGDAVGVPGLTPSSLRHSFATHAELWGLSELMVQRILRHTGPRTQTHYRHADLTNMAAAVAHVRYAAPAPRATEAA